MQNQTSAAEEILYPRGIRTGLKNPSHPPPEPGKILDEIDMLEKAVLSVHERISALQDRLEIVSHPEESLPCPPPCPDGKEPLRVRPSLKEMINSQTRATIEAVKRLEQIMNRLQL